MNSEDKKKKEQEIINIAAVEQEIKENKEEQAQEQAKAIRAKNTETFFVKLQDTSEAREALEQEKEFYVTLRTRGVTLEDVQGLSANVEKKLNPMFSSFSADIIRQHEKAEKPSSAKQESAKVIQIDLTKIQRSADEEFARVFPIVDKDKDGKLDEAEFNALREKTHILTVGETLKEGARQLSEAVSPIKMEKENAENQR